MAVINLYVCRSEYPFCYHSIIRVLSYLMFFHAVTYVSNTGLTLRNFLCSFMCIMSAAYLRLADSSRSGCTVGAVVQVLVVGCVVVHIERKDKTPWEDSAHGVIHLVGKYETSLQPLQTSYWSAEPKATHALHLNFPCVWTSGGSARTYNLLSVDL